MINNLVDAHCHLDHPDFAKDFLQVLERARRAGLEAVVNAGGSRESNERILGMRVGREAFFKVVLGVSPFEAVNLEHDDAALEAEAAFLEKHVDEIVGVGEIGLDWHYFKSDAQRQAQLRVFEALLNFAEDRELPVEAHSRDAEAEVIKVLAKRTCKKILHCFRAPRFLEAALDAGCFVSVPTLKSRDALTVIEKTPLDRLLCETDSPFLWKDVNGKSARNEPANVKSVYEKISETKGVELSEVEAKIRENIEKIFGF